MPPRFPSTRVLFAIVLTALLVLTLAPARWSGWVTAFHRPLMALVAPVSWPWSALARRVRPGGAAIDDLPAELAEKQRQVEFWRAEALASRDRVRQLDATIRALQQGVPMGGSAGYRVLEAARIGFDVASGAVLVRRGSRDGVELGAIAVPTSQPQHLLGAVTQVSPMVSTIHLVNDPRFRPGLIEVVLLADAPVTPAQLDAAPRCQVRATAGGAFTGEIGAEAAAAMPEGALAFLSDPQWPAAAQMLIVGRVSGAEPSDDPLWRRIIIRPELDLARISSVILRLPADDRAEGPGGGGAP